MIAHILHAQEAGNLAVLFADKVNGLARVLCALKLDFFGPSLLLFLPFFGQLLFLRLLHPQVGPDQLAVELI